MLGKHAINVHVQLAGAGVIVAREGKADVSTSPPQFAQHSVITLVTTDPVPAKADDAFDLVLIQQLDRKSTRLNSSHVKRSRMPSSA